MDMAAVIIGAFPDVRHAKEAKQELEEAGAVADEFAVLGQDTTSSTVNTVVDTLITIGLPEQLTTHYATVIDAGGVALSIKDATLSEQEVEECFTRHAATDIRVITPGIASGDHSQT
jgi:hypothetical protein